MERGGALTTLNNSGAGTLALSGAYLDEVTVPCPSAGSSPAESLDDEMALHVPTKSAHHPTKKAVAKDSQMKGYALARVTGMGPSSGSKEAPRPGPAGRRSAGGRSSMSSLPRAGRLALWAESQARTILRDEAALPVLILLRLRPILMDCMLQAAPGKA